MCQNKNLTVYFSALLFFSILIVVLSYQFLDKSISLFVYKHSIPQLLPGMHYFSMLGKNVVVASLCLIYILYARWILQSAKYSWQGLYLFSCVALANICCVVLKIFFGRARPMQWLQHDNYGFFGPIYQADFWSFPSGHSISSMSVVFGLCFLFPRFRKWFLAIGLALVLSRILLLRHYLSDVFAASILAYIISLTLYKGYFKEKIVAQQNI